MDQKNRVSQYDVIKAICIIGIVFAHACHPLSLLGYFYIYGFYFVAGITFKMKPFKEFFIRKIKRIYIPFVLANLAAISFCKLLSILTKYKFYKPTIKYILHIFLFDLRESIMAPAWFILPFFIVLFMMYFLLKFVKKDKLIFNICFFCFLFVLFFSDKLNYIIWNNCAIVINVFIGLFVTVCGYYFNKNKRIHDFVVERYSTELFFVSLVILCEINSYCNYHYDLRPGYFSNSYFMILTLFAGLFFLLYFSKLITKSKILEKVFSFIGKNSMFIMYFHIISFSLVTVLYKLLYGDYSVNWSNSITSGIWAVFSAIVGILLPLFLSYLFKIIKNKINIWWKNRINKNVAEM